LLRLSRIEGRKGAKKGLYCDGRMTHHARGKREGACRLVPQCLCREANAHERKARKKRKKITTSAGKKEPLDPRRENGAQVLRTDLTSKKRLWERSRKMSEDVK